jgi:hypothetical protein
MHVPNPSTLTFAIVGPLVAWRVYARFRRMVGRQRLSKARPWITVGFFPCVVLALGFMIVPQTQLLGWLGSGVFLGSLLGVFGLRKTRFEATPEGLFYTPNAHLGIALSLLFAARIVFRFVAVPIHETTADQGGFGFSPSPLTLAVFGLLAGYYVAYAIGLIRWRLRSAPDADRAPMSEPPSSTPSV